MTHRTMNRRTFALAGLGAIAGVNVTLAQPATPTSPTPATLYSIDLSASSLPAAPVAFGAAGVVMAPGTTVVYPEGAAGRSVGVDHILAGGYEIESDSELIHIDAAGATTEVPAGGKVTVAAGETVVILHNEAAQRITVGDEETRTFTIGFFSLQQGTNETEVEGTLEQSILGGVILQAVPESGVTLTIVPTEDASSLADVVAQIPMTLSTGEEWTAVLVPQAGEATPVA